MKKIWNWLGNNKKLWCPVIIGIALALAVFFPYHATFGWRLTLVVCGFVTGLLIIIWSNIHVFTSWPNFSNLPYFFSSMFIITTISLVVIWLVEVCVVIYLGLFLPLPISQSSLRLVSYGSGLFVGLFTSHIPKKVENKNNSGEGK